MKFYQNWTGSCGEEDLVFSAQVPGNIQLDYARANQWGDINYRDNCLKYRAIEDYTWYYKSELNYNINEGERLYFVSKGIDYKFDIILNDTLLHSQEGMFTPVEIDITDYLKDKNKLSIKIYPHPKSAWTVADRAEADESVKPAVCYGWDWHPRVLVSGIWDETYLETRKNDYLSYCEPKYILSEDYKYAEVDFDISSEAEIEIFSPSGQSIYVGDGKNVRIENPKLWWCRGQGKANLYRWTARTASDEKNGTIGFRRIRLVMNEGAWNEPTSYPMSRSNPPITIELNGRRIFAKGSNFVNPEIFTGTITKETYKPLIEAAVECNMNIFRCWGGAIVEKESFFELCDENGIMVWQEFPLACNEYRDIPEYLKTLEQEAVSIVKRLRKHPCHVLWCGGNELFNHWSHMTDQSLALRLLDKICYEYDYAKPYIMTSPLSGMAHGPYGFFAAVLDNSTDVYTLFNDAHYTAYTEFGVRTLCEYDTIRKYILPDETENFKFSKAVEAHLGHDCWAKLALDGVMMIFGETDNLEKICEYANILSAEGYKAIFEEARRQKPYCSMSLNWCFNEPWVNFSNSNLLTYPNIKKRNFYAVKESNKDVTLSAKFSKFSWKSSSTVKFEIWLLNDTYERVSDTADIYYEVDGKKVHLYTWNTQECEPLKNVKGPEISFTLPEGMDEMFKITLVSSKRYSNEYILKRDNLNEEKSYRIECEIQKTDGAARRMNSVLEE